MNSFRSRQYNKQPPKKILDPMIQALINLATKRMVSGSSGTFSQAVVAATTVTVTFGGTRPNTNYKVNITPVSVLATALFYVNNKTTTTFDVTYLGPLTGTLEFDWLLID